MAEQKLNERTKEISDKLKAKIEDIGMTIVTLANKADIKRYTLDRRLAGYGEYTVAEMEGISKALKLTVAEKREIFLI